MQVKELFSFIQEREQIRIKKERGDSRPWTTNKILQQFRFTCVFREDDKVTRWIAENWRVPHKTDPDIWFAMTVARKVNLPESLADVGYPVPWNPDRFKLVMRDRQRAGKSLEGAAYMITAGTGERWKGVAKYKFLADGVFTPMWENRAKIRPTKKDTLESFHARLQAAGNTVGSFIAAQILADVKQVEPLKSAPDWWTWAASGPGSRRGLNRIVGRPVDAPWKEEEWLATARELQAALAPLLKKAGMRRMCLQDTQGIAMCEWDKHERARLGEGRPKQRYDGVGDTVGRSQPAQSRLFGRTVV